MRIGIVTVQDSNNFGSFLQAYALQHVLKELSHEPYFIRTRSKKYIQNIFYKNKPSRYDLLHLPKFILDNYNGQKKYQLFQKEQECFKVIDEYSNDNFDLIILGSDEIWNVETLVFRNSIFYGKDMDPVMAYAVSIGNSTNDEMKCIPTDYFYRIHPILARDRHTSEFLKSISIDAPVVCDPTLLVDKSIFYRPYNHPLLNNQSFLLIYTYGLDEEIIDYLKKFAYENNLFIYSTCFKFEWCDGYFDCAALDFSEILRQASYVFTSTFHGTIFSILNHKQFISLPQSRKTSDLLQELKISNRLINKDNYAEISQKLKNEIMK